MIRVNMDDTDLEYAGIDAGGGNMWNYQGKPFTGVIEEFYSNGNLAGETECKEGYTEGVQRLYYEDGRLERDCSKRHNHFYGTSRYWDESGNLLLHVEYDSNGKEVRRIVG